jgi:hypothetical protein
MLSCSITAITLLGFAGLYLLLGFLFVAQILKLINRGPEAGH